MRLANAAASIIVRANTEMALERGTRLGPYEITDRVGAGGMGEVYRAHDPRLGRDVAIKVLPTEFAADADRLRRFEVEARAAAALNHPNILAVYDIGEHEGTPYVVAELLEGDTLRAELMQGPLPLRRVLEFARQISGGLAAAHARGIVHRDLKPENIFLTNDGRLKILDFGLAKVTSGGAGGEHLTTVLDVPQTHAGAVLGTIGYMAPEQATGSPLDFRCDQFAFGVRHLRAPERTPNLPTWNIHRGARRHYSRRAQAARRSESRHPSSPAVARRAVSGEKPDRALRIDARPGARSGHDGCPSGAIARVGAGG
jgi:serine/threonine protein kinase